MRDKYDSGEAMAGNISLQDVQQAVGKVMHPAISRTLVELGMAKDVVVEGNEVGLTLALPIQNIPTPVKDYLISSLMDAVATLGLHLKIEIAEMNEEERQTFLAMERESWKGL